MLAIYHPEAEAELAEATRFYERRVPTLGVQFLHAVDKSIATILEAPLRPPITNGDVRRYLMTRFPYGIYYRVFQDHLRILAFKHHSRHSDYWRSRLAD